MHLGQSVINFTENLRLVQERIAAAAAAAGRDAAGIRLVAVSKRHSLEAVRALFEAGQRDFGENQAQEALPKIESFSPEGLPVGLQIVGPPLADLAVLKLAHAFEAATGFAANAPSWARSASSNSRCDVAFLALRLR